MLCEFPKSPLLKHFRLAFSLCSILAFSTFGQSQDGLWKSDGYGLVIEMQNESMQAFETTSISCVRSWSALRSGTPSADGAAVFQEGGRVIRIKDGGSFHTRKMHFDGNASDIILQKISKLPEACGRPVPDTPPTNYA